jgi:hypothetical protein
MAFRRRCRYFRQPPLLPPFSPRYAYAIS